MHGGEKAADMHGGEKAADRHGMAENTEGRINFLREAVSSEAAWFGRGQSSSKSKRLARLRGKGPGWWQDQAGGE
jgi:hypothetical protein